MMTAESQKQEYAERVWLDLIFKGGLAGFHAKGGIAEKLNAALDKINAGLVELKAKMSISSQRGKGISLGELELAHVNLTITFFPQLP